MCFSLLPRAGQADRRLAGRGGGRGAGAQGAREGRELGLRAAAAARPGAGATASTPAPSGACRTAWRCPTAGWASTWARAPPRPTPRRSPRAGTVFWNGPMGAFELEPFAARHARAWPRPWPSAPGTTVVGGGDSGAALAEFGLADRRGPPVHRRRRRARAARGQEAARRGGARRRLSRDAPFIAGNWKLWGTRAEAREYCERLLELLPDGAAARRRGPVRAVHRARRRACERCAGSGVWVCAQNMHARGDRRVHRRGVGGDAARAGRGRRGARATPSAAQYDGETDRALQDKVPAALEAGLRPILCVGETEEEREARRDRAQAAPPGAGGARARAGRAAGRGRRSPTSRSGRSAPARWPRPSIAQEAIALRARARGRPLAGGRRSACGCSTAAASSPTTRRRSSPSPTWTARWWAARASTPSGFARIVGGRPARSAASRRRAWSSSTAGGSPTPGPGNAVELADTPVFDELWERHPHTTLTAWGPRSGLPEGQMGNSRGRPPEPRRRRGRQAGPAAHRRGDRGRLLPRERGAARRLSRHGARCTCWAWCPPAACTRAWAT